MSELLEAQRWAQMIADLVALDSDSRAAFLTGFEEEYGRAPADRLRRDVEKKLASLEGRLVEWDGESFIHITPEKKANWKAAYPGVNIDTELAKARAYLQANPGTVKSRYERFLQNWFAKEMAYVLRNRKSVGKMTSAELLLAFRSQHDASRVCPEDELVSHLSRQPVGMRYVVDWLFDRMLVAYGAAFASKWAGADLTKLKNEFAHELAKLSTEEIKIGYSRLKSQCPTYPPGLHEFIALCRPVESVESVFMRCAVLAAKSNMDPLFEWSEPVLYWTCTRFGLKDLATAHWNAAKTRFTEIYTKAVAQADAGDLPAIPARPTALAAPSTNTQRSSDAENALAACKAMLRSKPSHALIGGSM